MSSHSSTTDVEVKYGNSSSPGNPDSGRIGRSGAENSPDLRRPPLLRTIFNFLHFFIFHLSSSSIIVSQFNPLILLSIITSLSPPSLYLHHLSSSKCYAKDLTRSLSPPQPTLQPSIQLLPLPPLPCRSRNVSPPLVAKQRSRLFLCRASQVVNGACTLRNAAQVQCRCRCRMMECTTRPNAANPPALIPGMHCIERRHRSTDKDLAGDHHD